MRYPLDKATKWFIKVFLTASLAFGWIFGNLPTANAAAPVANDLTVWIQSNSPLTRR